MVSLLVNCASGMKGSLEGAVVFQFHGTFNLDSLDYYKNGAALKVAEIARRMRHEGR